MEHQFSFRVELTASQSPYLFKDKYLNVTVQNSGNPYFAFISDENGFLIFKSFEASKANELYNLLLSNGSLTNEIFNFFTTNFTLIFFDNKKQLLCYGKDRLGLSSLIINEDPLILSSHDLVNSVECAPGITVMNENEKYLLSFPSFERSSTLRTGITVDEAVDLMINTLKQSVTAAYPVLFSGGLDSCVLAGIIGLLGAPQCTLVNFCACQDAPDRLAARQCFADLTRSFPNTKFDLCEFTGTVELMQCDLPLIKSLLVPSELTEMNLNIAMSIYSGLKHVHGFAAYSGLGADELLCGYMRMKKDENANEEIAEHINRLWTRNGGRDDRVAMHLGKMVSCPYLSSEFINLALSLPVNMLIRPDLPRGEGEKWILRQVALRLGLETAAKRPKQAMQFGNRVAKTRWRGTEKMPQS